MTCISSKGLKQSVHILRQFILTTATTLTLPLICFMIKECDQLMSFYGLQLIILMSPNQQR